MKQKEFFDRLKLSPFDHIGHLAALRQWRAENPAEAAAEDAEGQRSATEFKEKMRQTEARRRTWIKIAAEIGIEPHFDYEKGQHLFRCVKCGASGEPFHLNYMGDIEADDDDLADILTVSVCEKCHPQAIEE